MPEALCVVADPDEAGDSTKNSKEDFDTRLRRGLESFAESLNGVLIDITALEVNTIVVDEIKGYKFIPEEAYQDIYFCLNAERKIPKSLDSRLQREIEQLENLQQDVHKERIPPQFRYSRKELLSETNDSHEEARPETQRAARDWVLREKLTREYCQIFFPIIYGEHQSNPTMRLGSNLPFPYDLSGNRRAENLYFSSKLSNYVLKNNRFLRSLRKISELKAANDRNDKIYAQTIIQLDGDVINRYRHELFNPEDSALHRDLLIDIHHRGVAAGEAQWRGLLEFCIKVVRNVIASGRDQI